MKNDNRVELYHQVKTMYEFIEQHLYEPTLTEHRAKEALKVIHLAWVKLDRRAK